MLKTEMTLFGEMPMAKASMSIRETLARYGSESVGIKELTALLVGLDVYKFDLLLNGEGVYSLLTKTLPELERITTKGVAAKIFALGEVIRRQRCLQPEEKPLIQSPQDVSNLLMGEMRELEQEEFRIILLNTKNRVLSVEKISKGTLNSSLVHPREVFRTALKKASNAIILVHNHPSGEPSPSSEDCLITKRLLEAGQLLGIQVMDHVIIGDGRYVSLKEQGTIV